ncbi:hypothetical protein TrST_g9748 [Triparma strigata]|uniref:Leucine-rich repeat domain-containing protein n=1 Tax=Triparma strigata TaxID=1606541 RepID=A0A9W7B602_9STRA|nr:hypothetical protein TrST_g9748 [Triparma strigata]
MASDDFKREFVKYVMADTLVAMRWLDRKWHKVVEKKLIELEDEPFGEVIVHGGNDISWGKSHGDVSYEEDGSEVYARIEAMKQVTKAVFLLNITKVGDRACASTDILVVVDIPEGITSIGMESFTWCSSLKDIKFPKSLTSIGVHSFYHCSSLEEVDLLHTNVTKLDTQAFWACTSLRKMKIPDSLQYCGPYVFMGCPKLVPSGPLRHRVIEQEFGVLTDVTYEVVAYLRSIQ